MSLYQPLDKSKNEIRLLYFLDDGALSETQDGSPTMIKLEMKTVSLHDGEPSINFSRSIDSSSPQWDAPTHEARWKWGEFLTLSYTWGSHQNPRTILVNNHPFQVTENLESFLRYFRNSYLDRIDNQRTGLWIDAICLNQKDIAEKNVHIKSMKDIYSRALTTIVWLGPETAGTRQAMEYIDLASESHFECLNTSTGGSENKCKFLTDARENCLESGLIKSLQEIVTRPYWTRLWVIQELALSGPNMKILCGDTYAQWKNFNRAILQIFNGDRQVWHKARPESGVDINLFQASLNRLSRLSSVAGQLSARNQRSSTTFLTGLFRIMRSSEQKDLRDKVYGVVSLLDPSLAMLIMPDYELGVEEVFLDFARALVGWSGGLDVVFEQARYKEWKEGGNSWVPRWERLGDGHPNPMGAGTSFRASGEAKPGFRFEGEKLVARGFFVDVIPEQWGVSTTTTTSPEGDTNIGKMNPYGDEDARREAIWRTLVADSEFKTGKRAPAFYQKILNFPLDIPDPQKLDMLDHCLGAFYDMRREYFDLPLWGKKFGDYFPASAETTRELVAEKGDILPWKDKDDLQPFTQCRFMISTRKLVVTGKGYLGLARMEVKKGDLVAILFDCGTPVVLRRRKTADGGNEKQEEYDIIGQAYIHGLMDGEGMGMLEMGECALEDLVIC